MARPTMTTAEAIRGKDGIDVAVRPAAPVRVHRIRGRGKWPSEVTASDVARASRTVHHGGSACPPRRLLSNTAMNEMHLEFLASDGWAKMLETDLLPWIVESGDLGDDVLEIGPGPGLTTDLLRTRVPRVTALELDDDLAANLSERLKGTNVDVIHGDATNSGLSSDRFTTATCFSM